MSLHPDFSTSLSCAGVSMPSATIFTFIFLPMPTIASRMALSTVDDSIPSMKQRSTLM